MSARAKYQRRHYEDMAGMLRDMLHVPDRTLFTVADVSNVTERMITLFSLDNPLFNPDRFRDAIWQHPDVTNQPPAKRRR